MTEMANTLIACVLLQQVIQTRKVIEVKEKTTFDWKIAASDRLD